MMMNGIMFVGVIVISISAFLLAIAAVVGGAGDKVACSTCGHRFMRTYINTIFSMLETPLFPGQNYLKCPKCKIRNECSVRPEM